MRLGFIALLSRVFSETAGSKYRFGFIAECFKNRPLAIGAVKPNCELILWKIPCQFPNLDIREIRPAWRIGVKQCHPQFTYTFIHRIRPFM